jgi:hypothetical protein
VEGQTLHVVDDADDANIQRGTELKVTPHSDGLRGRIWYGSGHLASAEGAAAQRLRLITGTILHSADPELSFSDYQARLIAAYRAAWRRSTPPAFGLEENVRLLTDMAATVGPALGWTPAG